MPIQGELTLTFLNFNVPCDLSEIFPGIKFLPFTQPFIFHFPANLEPYFRTKPHIFVLLTHLSQWWPPSFPLMLLHSLCSYYYLNRRETGQRFMLLEVRWMEDGEFTRKEPKELQWLIFLPILFPVGSGSSSCTGKVTASEGRKEAAVVEKSGNEVAWVLSFWTHHLTTHNTS